jgi:membrane dipeptidase
LVETFNDLRDARRQGRYAALLYTQKVPRLDGDPAGVAAWFDAGLRIVQLAYNSREPLPHLRAANKLAGGADEPEVGLTDLGRAAVGELVARHMVIDVSHCSERTTMEVIAMTDVPILANHANAKALTVTMRDGRPLGRNKSDRELRAIAATGGVVGINTVGWMLDRDGDGRTGIEDFLAHVDYCVRLLGIDHVGLSSDAIVDGWAPDDIHYADAVLASPDRWRVVARRLRADYGYTDAMLRQLLGGNFLRVYEAVLPGLGAPESTSPDDGVAVGAGSVVLEWRPAAARGVAVPTYDVEIDGERRATALTGTRLELTELDSGQHHRWRVLARSGRWVTASAWRSFTFG